ATGVVPTSVAPVLAGRRFLRLLGSRDRLRGQHCRRCRSRRSAVVVAVLFTGFENAQSQRRPAKPRMASIHLRPRPVALPHLRCPLPVLGDGSQTHRACARRKHAAEHVRILHGRSLAAKETSMILPPRPIVEPEIADLSDLDSTTMRSDRGFASLWPRVLLASGGALTGSLVPIRAIE